MERKFELLPGTLQVLLEHGEAAEDIVPVLLDAAEFARARQLRALLVVSGLGDPATAATLSTAIEQIHALGARPPLMLAFVAYLLPQYGVYHFAEQHAQKLGIRAKVLVSIRQAKAWLGLREDENAATAVP